MLSNRRGMGTCVRAYMLDICEPVYGCVHMPKMCVIESRGECMSVLEEEKSSLTTLIARVHKNKSMQHHTLGSGTAEFQVTWPPKLREGTYLVKNVRARFEYRKTIAALEKQVIMQEKALACDVRLHAPSESVFLQSTLQSLTMCVCLYHLTFLRSYQPLCEFSWRKKKEKAR